MRRFKPLFSLAILSWVTTGFALTPAIPFAKKPSVAVTNTPSPITNSPTPSKQSFQIKRSLLEVKAGYFFFSDTVMGKIYNEGGLDLQLTGSTPIWKWLHFYASAEYLSRHGKTLNFHSKTSIWEVPISAGLQGVLKIFSKADYYLTVGPRYFFVHVHNNSPYLNRTLNQNGAGWFINTGAHFFPLTHFVIDIFGEYSYKMMEFHAYKGSNGKNREAYGKTVQVGGFTFGGGLGYAF